MMLDDVYKFHKIQQGIHELLYDIENVDRQTD